jgi:hypothetical protein
MLKLGSNLLIDLAAIDTDIIGEEDNLWWWHYTNLI